MLARLRWTRALTWGVVVVVVGAVVTGGWWFGVRGAQAAEGDDPVTTTTTTAASLTAVEKTVTATGTLTPAHKEEISFLGSGTVTSVVASVGDEVTEGQVLATIDTLQLDADLLQARADLATARATHTARVDEDDGSDAAAARTAAAAAQVELARVSVTVAEEAMSGATLVAPAAGHVTQVAVTVGDVVTGSASTSSTSSGAGGAAQGQAATAATSSAAFVVVGDDQWQVEATVGDADVALLATGDQAEITLDGREDVVFGTVAEIGLVSTSTSGVPAYPVTIAITGAPDGLYDGVSAEVSIVYERRTGVLTVPSAAVRTVDGESVVTVVDAEGTQVTTTVTVGETVGQSTEVVSGLVEGDEVVVTVVQREATQRTDQEPAGGGIPGELPEGFPDGFVPGDMPAGGFPGTGGGGNG